METYKGTAQLSGFVNSQKAVDKAIEIARSVKGVIGRKLRSDHERIGCEKKRGRCASGEIEHKSTKVI